MLTIHFCNTVFNVFESFMTKKGAMTPTAQEMPVTQSNDTADISRNMSALLGVH